MMPGPNKDAVDPPHPAAAARPVGGVPGRWVRPERTAALATAAMALVPYTTLGLPFRVGLQVQAAGITVLMLGVLTLGIARPGGVLRLRLLPMSARVPALLWVAAAILGGLVGLVSGHPPPQVMGQVLALGLLPAGIAAGVALPRPGGLHGVAGGVLAAALVASALHLAVGLTGAPQGAAVPGLALAHGTSFTGLALLTVPVALAAATLGNPGLIRLATAAVPLTLLYVAGTGVRSLWLALPCAVAVTAVLMGREARRTARPVFLALLAVPALGLAAAGALSLLLARAATIASFPQEFAARHLPLPPGVQWMQGTLDTSKPRAWVLPGAGSQSTFDLLLPVPGPGAYRVEALVDGGATDWGTVAVQWTDASGRKVATWTLSGDPRPGRRRLTRTGSAPEGGSHLRLVADSRGGPWRIEDVRVVRLGSSPLLAAAFQWRSTLWERLASLRFAVAGSAARQQGSIGLRLEELAAVSGAMERAGAGAWTWGHGLGATLPFATVAPDDTGRWVPREGVNYLHNFYAFLLFKLGLGGSAAILAAVGLWIAALAAMPKGGGVAWSAAALGALAGYLVWGLACPELINFRVAPLLGMVVGLALAWTPNRSRRLSG